MSVSLWTEEHNILAEGSKYCVEYTAVDNTAATVNISDRTTATAFYYNIMDFSDEIASIIRDRYDESLSSIGAPHVTLEREKEPRQLDSNTCRLPHLRTQLGEAFPASVRRRLLLGGGLPLR